MDLYYEKAASLLRGALSREPERVFFAPGRVNLIGEHIDYSGGHVLPCSLSLGTYAAAAKRDDGLIRLISADVGGAPVISDVLTLSRLPHSPEAFLPFGWAAYPLGVAAKLMGRGYCIGGFDMAVCGSLPRGSGLSSSASLEVLTCAVLDGLFGLKLDGVTAACLSREAEHDCAGVNCGIMDQFICANGRDKSALLLDTSTLERSYFPFDLGENVLLIMNTKKPRRLAESRYNERRAECEEALSLLNEALEPKKEHLCGITPEEFSLYSQLLPEPVVRRARHAVTEERRTLLAAEALAAGNIAELGRLMNASHDSLRYDYEVTGKELDSIVMAARAHSSVLGARMTGAGFGGCAIAICPASAAEEAIADISRVYLNETGLCCEIYAAQTADAPFGRNDE
jgi:galactokinase